jgi:hypothetical protein
VGRNNEVVRPVVARIELLRGPRPDSAFKPLTVPTTPITPGNQPASTPSSSSSRASSGRYGVFMNSSSSSDGNSSPISDHESDIEEIPASGANALPLRPRGSLSADSGSHIGRAFEALKRLLPPAHSPSAVREESYDEIFPRLQSPDYSLGSPGYLPSPIYSPTSPSPPSFSPRLLSPMFQMRNSLTNIYSHYPMGFDAAHHDVFEDYVAPSPERRSSSPMDLASPSPPLRDNYTPTPEQAPVEPNIIGAWPKSRSASPIQSTPTSIEAAGAPPVSTLASIPAPDHEQASGSMSSSEPPDMEVTNEAREPEPSPVEAVALLPDPSDRVNSEVSELQSGLAKLQVCA